MNGLHRDVDRGVARRCKGMDSVGRYLLNCVYLGLILLALPVLLMRRLTQGKYREGWGQKFLGRVPRRTGSKPCLWLHAVSVGEVLQVQPVVASWRERHPDWDIYISTTTATGRQLAEKNYPDCTVCYCPLDFTWAVGQAFRRIRPDCLALVELELWPNLILEARRRRVASVLINGRLSEKSFRGYRKLRWLVAPLLRSFRLIAVQNQEYAQRFRHLGARPDQLLQAGSIKFDRLRTDRQAPAVRALQAALALPENKPVLMAGSTHAPEEELMVQSWLNLRVQRPDLHLILAPRHAERFDQVAEQIEQKGVRVIRRSVGLKSGDSETSREDQPTVYLLDTLGELSACWGLAHFAYVGGSLNQRGGQNMMEPAAFGCAVLFGPNTWNFADVVSALKAREACREVASPSELEQTLRELLLQPRLAREMGGRAREYVLSQQGGTQQTVAALESILLAEDQSSVHRAA